MFESVGYGFKRIVRSSRLFAALIIGVLVATTFFASINISADISASRFLRQALERTYFDAWIGIDSDLDADEIRSFRSDILGLETPDIVEVEIISNYDYYNEVYVDSQYEYTHLKISGLFDNSTVYDESEILSGSGTLGVNETLVDINSPTASNYELNDVLTVNLTVYDYMSGNLTSFILNFTIVGFVKLTEDGLARVNVYEGQYRTTDLFLVDWDLTFAPLINYFANKEEYYNPITSEIKILLDRDSLINPFDLTNSRNRIQQIIAQIENIAYNYNAWVYSPLIWQLQNYEFIVTMQTAIFFAISLPVFFMAWYMGTTVSDISFNLRRREIGLLQTRGFNQRSISWMFIIEAALIGLFAGAIGAIIGMLITPTLMGLPPTEPLPQFNITTYMSVVLFGVIVAVISVFRPARRAAKLATVDALRQYVLVEDTAPFKKILPWTALILGSYKLIIWILGINIQELIWALPMNFFLYFIVGVWMVIDNGLNYVGPLLFAYGLTKIGVRGSYRIQDAISRVGKRVVGELGEIASKSARRNPARNAAVAFILGLIIWYGIATLGNTYTTRDFYTRQLSLNIGADMGVTITDANNASTIQQLIQDMDGVTSTTTEFLMTGESAYGSSELRAINPSDWDSAAFFELDWFTGATLEDALQALEQDNETIILDVNLADYLDIEVGENIAISLAYGGATYYLKVVGLFGPRLTPPRGILDGVWFYQLWSYIPNTLFQEHNESVSESIRILADINPLYNATAIGEQVADLGPDVSSVQTVEEEMARFMENAILSASLVVQQVGVYFALVIATLGTVLVTLMTLRERRTEMALMSVRGLSFGQISRVLLVETLGIILFSVFLGITVGFINIYGSVAFNNTTVFYSPIRYRFFVDNTTILQMVGVVLSVILSAAVPTIIAAKRAEKDVSTLRM